MTPSAARHTRVTSLTLVVRGLGVVTAALLAIDAYVHLDDAGLYDFGTGASITEGTLFRIEASVAIVVAIALLVWPGWPVWIVAIIVAGSAVGAVYLYTYVDVGRLGPLPDMYEPTWALPGKRLAAGAEIAATVTALAGLGFSLYARKKNLDRHGNSKGHSRRLHRYADRQPHRS